MADYTDQAKIEAYLKRPLSDYEVTTLETAISAVMKFVDTFTGRTFNADTDVTRYYDGTGKRELFIEDWATIDSISYVDDDLDVTLLLVEGEDYVLYPLNTAYKNSVLLRGGRWTIGSKNIKIVGDLGQAAIPNPISIVATVLVSRILQNPQNFTKRSIEGYAEEYGKLIDDVNKGLLEGYQKVLL